MDFELHPDDYTIEAQHEQCLKLMEDLKQEGMVDKRMLKALEGPEAIGDGSIRSTIRRYHEGGYGLVDAAAEIEGRAG